MTFFKHRHYWRAKTNLINILAPEACKPVGTLFLEDCLCGAIRQIELRPGESPVIRITEAPEKAP